MNCPKYLKNQTIDGCAECLTGLGTKLPGRLWSLLNTLEEFAPNPYADSDPEAAYVYHIEHRTLDKVWKKLTEEEQATLIEAAKKEGWERDNE